MGKIKDFNSELNKFNKDDLLKKIDELRRTRFSLLLASATAHIKDVSQFKKLSRNLARALTILHNKKFEA